MKLIILAAFTLVLCFRQEIAHAQCAELFSSSRADVATDSTDRLISYLSQLLENNAIGERELVTLREGLERGQWVNPIFHQDSAYGPVFATSATRIQYQVIQQHFKTQLDSDRVNIWLRDALQEKKRVRVEREEAREETQNSYRKMEFHRLPPGQFKMGDMGEKPVRVKLTQSIEMMSSLITQKMWAEVMGENPSYFKDGPESVEMEINGSRVRMRPDHPVENVSWWSVIVFANRLSEKAGFKPAYDLSEVKTEGRAEDGTLSLIEGEVRINAPDGDIYQAEGFRLPTNAEQEYVLRNLGRSKGKYPHGLREQDLVNYAWYSENAGDSTRAVGTTWKSFSIEGNVFDDLIGNVAQWSHDFGRALVGGTDPVDFSEGKFRGNRGGSWDFLDLGMRSGARSAFSHNLRSRGTGARLVRTIK